MSLILAPQYEITLPTLNCLATLTIEQGKGKSNAKIASNFVTAKSSANCLAMLPLWKSDSYICRAGSCTLLKLQ